MIISAISWQLFGVGEVAIQRLFDLPLGLPFIIISSLFLVCSIFILIRAIKRKNIIEGVVLAILLYSIAICTLLSGRGVAPIGPTRHNLFFSPALFISFFIWIRGAYQTLNRSHLRIKEGILSTFLLVFLLTPNIARDYVTVTDREDLRSLLRKIQPTVKESDNVYLYVDDMGIPALRYEYEYSNIPWLKALTYKDISNHLTFRAGIDSGYDYQWYIFRGVSEDFGRVDRAKANLKQEHDVIVDKEYLLPRARVASFRARRRITGHP